MKRSRIPKPATFWQASAVRRRKMIEDALRSPEILAKHQWNFINIGGRAIEGSGFCSVGCAIGLARALWSKEGCNIQVQHFISKNNTIQEKAEIENIFGLPSSSPYLIIYGGREMLSIQPSDVADALARFRVTGSAVIALAEPKL